jgi:hypothetical protein
MKRILYADAENGWFCPLKYPHLFSFNKIIILKKKEKEKEKEIFTLFLHLVGCNSGWLCSSQV